MISESVLLFSDKGYDLIDFPLIEDSAWSPDKKLSSLENLHVRRYVHTVRLHPHRRCLFQAQNATGAPGGLGQPAFINSILPNEVQFAYGTLVPRWQLALCRGRSLIARNRH